MSNQYPPPSPPPSGYGSPYGSPQMSNPLTPPPGGTGPGGGKTSLGLDSNVGAMLCYLGNIACCVGLVLSIIFMVTEKDNRFVRFHAMQSILLTVAAIVLNIVLGVLGLVLSAAHLGFLGLGLRLIVTLVFVAIWVLVGIKAYQGEWYKLPVIGDTAENIAK
jgi:uncharacterized membrane protein